MRGNEEQKTESNGSVGRLLTHFFNTVAQSLSNLVVVSTISTSSHPTKKIVIEGKKNEDIDVESESSVEQKPTLTLRSRDPSKENNPF